MIGTRGVPAQYGGFETAVEEIGSRLADRGHHVTVYCRSIARSSGDSSSAPARYKGMELVHLPCLRRRSLETFSRTAITMAHQLVRSSDEVAVVFNAANAIFLPMFRIRSRPVATHVDGLEWKRGKWGSLGRRFYRVSEALAVRWSDALIADAHGISSYYKDEFGAATDEIAYGAPILKQVPDDKLGDLGLQSGRYHLVVARFEPENHVDVAIQGYLASGTSRPLILVGSAPYAADYHAMLTRLAGSSNNIRFFGSVWDQNLLNQLYAHTLTYVHGHSVGGTNPSLLRAMGAASPTIAWDVVFNREVVGESGRYFNNPQELGAQLRLAEANPEATEQYGTRLRDRARQLYSWDDVTTKYENLCHRLVQGRTQRGIYSGRRSSGR